MHMVAVGNMTTSSWTCFLHSTAQRALCASASEQPKRPGVRVSARVTATLLPGVLLGREVSKIS